MRVKQINYNWHQTGSVTDPDGVGENYDWFEVGKKGVIEIIEYKPENGLQTWNFVIKFEDGTVYRVFNPNFVEYFKNI